MSRVAAAVVILATLGWAGWELYSAGCLAREELVALARESGPAAPLIVMGALTLAVVIGPIPTIPISVASGVLFGPTAGFAYAMIGALAGAAISFWLARLAGRPLVARLFGGHIALCPRCSDRLLFWTVVLCRLLPVISFAFVSYGAGLTAMTTRAFLLATAIGMIPMTALYVAVGATLTVDPLWTAIGGAIAVAAVLALPRLVERFNPFGIVQLLPHGDDLRAPDHAPSHVDRKPD